MTGVYSKAEIASYFAKTDDELVVIAGADDIRHGFLRNRTKQAKAKVDAAIEACRDPICRSEAIKKAIIERADDHQLIAAILVAAPVPMLKNYGVGDALAFAILVFRSGVSNLCRQVWQGPDGKP